MANLLRSSLQAMLTCSLPNTLTHILYRYVSHNLTFLTTRILLHCTRSTVCLRNAPRHVGVVMARVAVVATGATKARVASAAAVAAVAAVAAIAAVAIKARVAAEAAVAAVAAV